MSPSSREIELEEEVELLKQRLEALEGTDRQLGVLMSIKYGMTHRTATILQILVNRAPAVVSRDNLHTLIHGDRSDGGPEPKIFNVYIHRLRNTLKRAGAPGQIETVWHAGFKASPALVQWVKDRYRTQITED